MIAIILNAWLIHQGRSAEVEAMNGSFELSSKERRTTENIIGKLHEEQSGSDGKQTYRKVYFWAILLNLLYKGTL